MFQSFSLGQGLFSRRAKAVLHLTAVAWFGLAAATATAQSGSAPQPTDAPTRSLPSDTYEQPRYTVLKQQGALEVRDYAPMLVAEVTLTGSRDQTLRDGFMVLARYIFGGNTQRASIAMTSPVTQEASASPRSEKIAMTSPVLQSSESEAGDGAGSYTVAFMLPSKYTLDTLPKPQDARIKFRVTEPQRRAVLRFSGMAGQGAREERRQELMEFVAANKLKPISAPAWAQYDDPFTLPWNRRNEWWVAVQ